MRRFLLLPLLLLGATPPEPATVRVRLTTAAGAIILALDVKRAPKTTANFLFYVDDGRFEGTTFFRAARAKTRAGGFIEGGIGTDPRRILPPVPIEPTDRTGLRHVDGAVSMARFDPPNSATGNFSIMVGPNPGMDAKPGRPGYAVFARVIAGMNVVRRILAQPTGGGSGAMKDQALLKPVTIVKAERLDGMAKPTGRPKPWALGL